MVNEQDRDQSEDPVVHLAGQKALFSETCAVDHGNGTTGLATGYTAVDGEPVCTRCGKQLERQGNKVVWR